MTIQEVKRYFFAYRNGVVADVLRRGGSGFRTLFGVQLAVLSQLAREIGYDDELARQLWEDSDVRESRLLSYYLMDPSHLTDADCRRLLAAVRDREDEQVLRFKLLTPFGFL